jgi:hypothetical protein
VRCSYFFQNSTGKALVAIHGYIEQTTERKFVDLNLVVNYTAYFFKKNQMVKNILCVYIWNSSWLFCCLVSTKQSAFDQRISKDLPSTNLILFWKCLQFTPSLESSVYNASVFTAKPKLNAEQYTPRFFFCNCQIKDLFTCIFIPERCGDM